MYVGEFVNGKVQGEGRLTFSDGVQFYVGEFTDSKMHGVGTFLSDKGIRTSGQWRYNKVWDGKEIDLSGKPVAIYTNGVRRSLLK